MFVSGLSHVNVARVGEVDPPGEASADRDGRWAGVAASSSVPPSLARGARRRWLR